MPRTCDNPRYNVVSMRVSDEERQRFETMATRLGISISQVMREMFIKYERQQATDQA